MPPLSQSPRNMGVPPAPAKSLEDVSWEGMTRAVEKIRERLLRAASALEKVDIPYAVTGGSAVAAWVSRVDEAAVRNTHDVDILLRGLDLERAKEALFQVGFVHRRGMGIDMFLDGEAASARYAVHLVFANEKVHPEYLEPTPDVGESVAAEDFRLVTLEALVRMKLTSFLRKDQMHLIDMVDVGLVDESWLGRFPEALSARLRELIENPEG
ncbi:MAG: hypothetical protein GHCLOJNM_00861 [bacterium]|nr:hypothetical protein [bacterium]